MAFQLTAARRRLDLPECNPADNVSFNSQPPEGGWGVIWHDDAQVVVSTHSRPKAAGGVTLDEGKAFLVSTHSRPKAAGGLIRWRASLKARFNSQPPEGGWLGYRAAPHEPLPVSTHSRPKAAGAGGNRTRIICLVSTHSRPKAAGFQNDLKR